MPIDAVYALVGISTAILVAGLMPALIQFLVKKDFLDNPNERSSHTAPTPRGGGWLALGIPLLGFLGALFLVALPADMKESLYALAAGLSLTMFVSGLDDRFSLGARVRLCVQSIAAILSVLLLPENVRVFPAIFAWAEDILLILGLVWMMNLTNFIDGINGITGVNGIAAATGFLLLGGSAFVFLPLSGALLIGALFGFLLWNWGKAKIFMGDVGSVPLGLWLGYGLILIAHQSGLVPALLLVLYPVADATYTLIRRAVGKQKIWQAHREHFYQKAVQNGRTHAQTSSLIAAFNTLCVALAFAATIWPAWEYSILAAAIVALVILWRGFTRKVIGHA